MKRLTLLVSIVALVAGACSSPSADSGASDVQTSSTTKAQVSGSTSPDSSTSTLAPDPSVSKPDGPVAPDFTLALASGESFTLSDAAKPVYMVFWAEW